jgi:hypothetical protein
MSDITIGCTYFEETGAAHTESALQIARARAEELGVRSVVVATTSGATGLRAAEVFADREVVVVTHSAGFREPNQQELTGENRAAIEAAGARILTCQHAFGGVGRALYPSPGNDDLGAVVASTLRVFGQGTKVACEIVLMAADAGMIRVGEPVISVAGTGAGADTVLVIAPAHGQSFFDLRVMEILCKPRFAPES